MSVGLEGNRGEELLRQVGKGEKNSKMGKKKKGGKGMWVK